MSAPATRTDTPLDPVQERRAFPGLAQTVNGKPLVYLDNAATAQKPLAVIEAVEHAYRLDAANVHRGAHTLGSRATQAFEATRTKLARWFNAPDERELIFVRGTTEAINLVAQAWARPNLEEGDEILITGLEHHSNIVPWQLVREQTGAVLKVAPVLDDGSVDVEAFERLVGPRTKLVSFAHVSNALGTVNPVRRMIAAARSVGARVLIDGAQAVPHMRVDLAGLDADFYAFSSHKLFGPTGVGVLHGKAEVLEAMPPWQGGGEMIRDVSFEATTFNALPFKFEAGTPNIVGVIGLGAAIDHVEAVGIDRIAAWEHELLVHATRRLSEIEGLRLIGTAPEKAAVLSFVLEGVHPQDLGTLVDQEGVAIRAGHHCAQPLMRRFGVSATARASLAFYNTRDDVDRLVEAIEKARRVFGLTPRRQRGASS